MLGRAGEEKYPRFTQERRWAFPGNDRVAILTRTKDRPILLARGLASILSQTHENWHLYLVNDGGDPLPINRLIDEYDTAFGGRLTVIHHEHSLGMEAASNRALNAARGNADYVAVHDDDDSWAPDFLATTTGFLGKEANSAFCAVAARPLAIFERIEETRVVVLRREAWNLWRSRIDSQYLLSRNSIPPICLLVRMAAVERIGNFNEAMPVLGDWDYNLRLLAISDIATIEAPLAHYHLRENQNDIYGNSVSAGFDKHQLYDVLYRNHLVRQAIQDNPANIGLLHILLRSMEDNRNETLYRLDNLNRRLDRLDDMDRKLDRLEHISRKLEWLSDRREATKAVAKEVWFEKQRWGLPYKISKWAKSRIGKISR